MTEKPRLWGIDVIGGVYTVASLLMVAVILMGSMAGVLFGLVMLILCVTAAVGMFSRNNSIRKMLVGLLYVAVFGDLLLVVIYIAALFQFYELPGKDPGAELMRVPGRVGLTIWMLSYLLRGDVREAFAEPGSQVES